MMQVQLAERGVPAILTEIRNCLWILTQPSPRPGRELNLDYNVNGARGKVLTSTPEATNGLLSDHSTRCSGGISKSPLVL